VLGSDEHSSLLTEGVKSFKGLPLEQLRNKKERIGEKSSQSFVLSSFPQAVKIGDQDSEPIILNPFALITRVTAWLIRE
jgi:hypothetical protein